MARMTRNCSAACGALHDTTTVLTEDAGHFQRGPVHGGYNAAGFCFVAGLLAAGLRSAGLTTCFIARGVTAV